MDKQARQSLIDQASALLAVSRQLDYLKILEHDRAEVAKLNQLLGDLPGSGQTTVDAALDLASAQARNDGEDTKAGSDEFKANREMAILQQLTSEGFVDRLGKVYNSRSEERSMEFRKVPHRKNLPEFDMIVSADYAPSAGLHGIIISEHHVMSVFLATPEEQNEWEILKRRPYDNMEEMGEFVTLLAAGFDLP